MYSKSGGGENSGNGNYMTKPSTAEPNTYPLSSPVAFD